MIDDIFSIKITTGKSVAFDSPDHILPNGTKNDNYSCIPLARELEMYCFDNMLERSLLDLGCAGGQFVCDLHDEYWSAIGVEGSDFNVRRQHHNWIKYHNKILFTADLTVPMEINYKFSFITAWEVIEHLTVEDLKQFFQTVDKYLVTDGLFLGTISTVPDNIGGIHYHQSVFLEDYWRKNLLTKEDLLKDTRLTLVDYPFSHAVRDVPNSFRIALKKEANKCFLS